MLNSEQKKAVEYHQGPLLIIAGAGTGKTTVITEKIKYLIKKKLAKPEEILALTFTEKAAYEMEERVDKTMPYGYFQMWISTFHSFADQILRKEISQIGLSSGYKLMTEAETILFLKKNLFLFDLKYFRPLGNPNKFLESLLDHFSRLRDEDVSPEEYLKWARNDSGLAPSPPKADRSRSRITEESKKIEREKSLELANAYKAYQQLKIKENVFDFSDLIFYLNKLFKERKNILKKYQIKFKYILIDEFQDTNIAQYNLIKLLCPLKSNPRLTVVGDDSQAIYKFRGASVSNILNFMKDYKKTKQITLIKNYRSNQTILNAAYKLIKNNDPDTLEAKLGISKKLIAVNSGPGFPINLYLSETAEDEAEHVVKQILSLKKNYSFSDFAILTRANDYSDPFIRALAYAGIPYQFLGPGMLFKQPEIKDLIAFLKFLSDVEDSPSFYRVLNIDIFNINIKDLSLLTAFSKKINQSLFQSLEIYLSFFHKDIEIENKEIYKKYLPLITKTSRENFYFIYTLILKNLKRTKKNTAGEILFYFLEETKILNKIANFKTEKEEKIALNITKFFNQLKTFETDHEDASVGAAVEFLDMNLEMGLSPIVSKTDLNLQDAVNIITVHSAKGLEFKVVFLVSLAQGRFPTQNRKELLPIPDKLIREILPTGDYHIEEERRLFYVGLTRAKEKVFLSTSKFYGESQRIKKISPFVYESLDDKEIEKELIKIKNKKSQLSIFDFKPAKTLSKIKRVNKNQVDVFSYTQLETYQRCPLQYKFYYFLNIPTSPTASLAFGNTIHRTLQLFYQKFIENNSVNKKLLFELYKNNWLPVGYLSKDHEQRMKKEGEKILSYFLKKFHNKNLQVLSVEKKFKIKISDFYINGKIDRIDRLSKKLIEIIDYKTGKKPDDRELKKSLQLSIYTLAATDPGLYKKNLNDVHLSFYYLNTGEKISFRKTREEIMETKEKIIEIVSKIRSSDFTPKVGRWCDFCSFRMICDFWR